MTLQFVSTTRDHMNTQIITDVGANGTLKIYDNTGGTPASATAAALGNVLVSMPCAATFGTTTGGVLTVGAITQTNATATGTASYVRFDTSATSSIVQGTTATSGADLNLNTTSVVSGGPVVVSSFTMTAPGA